MFQCLCKIKIQIYLNENELTLKLQLVLWSWHLAFLINLKLFTKCQMKKNFLF